MSYISSLWQVYLIWGLLIGVGRGCSLIPVISAVSRWFKEKRGIATGITVAGIGLGGIIWPPLAQGLISSYDWHRAFTILGLIAFVPIISLAQFMKQSPERTGVKAYGETGTVIDEQSLAATSGLSISQAIKAGRFWVFGAVHFCFMFCVQVLIVHIAPYAMDIGFSEVVAAGILSALAGSSTFGRLAMGFVSDRMGSRLAMILCFGLGTLGLIWILLAQEIWMFYIFAVLFGLAWGGTVPLASLVTAELFGLKSLGAILGGVILCGAVGGSLGSPLAGTIFDIAESYTLAFSICIALCTLAIIFSVILLRYRVKGGGVEVYNF